MRNYTITLSILICFFAMFAMISCHHQSNEVLVELNSKVRDNPDSVFVELNALQPDYHEMTNEGKALFDLTRFQLASLRDTDYPPLEVLDSVISYFDKCNNTKYASEANYCKAQYYKDNRAFEGANKQLLIALNQAQKVNCVELLPRIYFDLGHIACMQNRYDTALEYLNRSGELFRQNGDKMREAKVYDICSMAALGKNDYESIIDYSFKALNITSDSVTIGDLYSMIGTGYYHQDKMDSAQYYYHQSLKYPVYSTNLSLRYYNLADFFSYIENYDSVRYYIDKAFETPVDIYVMEESYRLLTDVALHENDKESASEYIRLRAICNDSIKGIEGQSDITVVSEIHEAAIMNKKQQSQLKYMIVCIVIMLIIIVLLIVIVQKKRRAKKKIVQSIEQHKETLEDISIKIKDEQEQKLNVFALKLQNFISENVSRENNKGSFQEREQMKKEAYIEFLSIDNEELFVSDMNYLLSSFPDNLKQEFVDINYKEIVWCCLFVLDIPTSDIALILNYTQSSQYKFKQRLCKKLQFANTKEFELFLRNLINFEA